MNIIEIKDGWSITEGKLKQKRAKLTKDVCSSCCFKKLAMGWGHSSGWTAILMTALLVSGCEWLSANDQQVPQTNVTRASASHEGAVRIEKPGLSNLRRVSDDLYVGAEPTGEGFRQLKAMGVKTVVNLRFFHDDGKENVGTELAYEEIPMNAWHAEDEDVVRFLKLFEKGNRAPFFIYCHHGADRSGLLCAVYRIVLQGWTKDEAIAEMTRGGYGFHGVWQNLVDYLRKLDVEKLKRQMLELKEPIFQTPHTD